MMDFSGAFYLLAWFPWAAITGVGNGTLARDPSLYFDGATFLRVMVGDKSCTSGQIYRTEIAATPEARAKGYSVRTEPPGPDEAMLFVYPAPEFSTFWMKDTHFPLDLEFFDAEGRRVTQYRMPVERDPADPQMRYPSQAAISAALEISPRAGVRPPSAEPPYLCIEIPS